jgi:hypothetical protein
MQTYLDKVDAVTVDDNTTVENIIPTLADIVKEYAAAYYGQFSGKYYTFKNAADQTVYISSDATQTYKTTTTPTVSSLWQIKYVYDETNHKYCCALYNEHSNVYFGSLTGFTQNARIPASATPVNYELLPSTATGAAENSWTLSSTVFSSDYSYVHSNSSEIIYWSNSGDTSRWIIEEADDDLVADLHADLTRVYVPVTSTDQIEDGGRYILESYNTDNSEMRILTMNASNAVGFQTPSDMIQNSALTTDRTIWTFTTSTNDWTCTSSTHASVSAGTFSLNNGGHYLKWAETATATVSTAVNSNLEFFKLEDASDASEGALFGIHYYVSADTERNRRYGVVNAAGSMGYNSRTGDDGTNSDSKTGYSSYFRLYRVYNSASQVPEGSTGTSLLTAMKDKADAIINPYATTITDFNTTAKAEALTSINNAATNSETAATLEEAGSIMTTAVNTAIEAFWEKFNGLYVTIQAHNGSYANASEGATGLTVTSATTSDAIWKLERVSGTTQYKIYNPLYELYVGSLSSFTQNAQIPIAATGVNYTLTMANTDKNVYIVTTGFTSTYNCWHLNTSGRAYPVYWSTGDNSTWTMTAATDDQKTILEKNITARSQNSYIGTELNQYTIDSDYAETYTTNYNALKAATELSAATTASTEMTSIYTSHKTINQPATGRYIRIKTGKTWSTTNASAFSNSQPYLTCVNNSDNTKAAYVTNLNSTDNIANSIFLLTDDSKLLAYATGRYGKTYHLNFDVSADGSTNTASAAATFAFAAASTETGAYTVKYGDRYLYTGTGLNTDSGSGTNTTGGYYFQLEYVSELPVTTNADGFATLKVPVAVTIPTVDGAEFYVGNIEGTTLTLHQAQAGETYAANTGVIVNAAAATTVNFPIATDATDADDTYTNAFQGSNVAQQVSNLVTDSDKSVYANSELTSTEESTTESAAVRRRVASSEDGTTSMTFTKLADTDVIGANAAMLVLDSTNTWADADGVISMPLSATEDDDATFNVANGDTVGITTVVVEHADGTSEIYDLQGRRVNPANLRRGIYIVNGEKRAM